MKCTAAAPRVRSESESVTVCSQSHASHLVSKLHLQYSPPPLSDDQYYLPAHSYHIHPLNPIKSGLNIGTCMFVLYAGKAGLSFKLSLPIFFIFERCVLILTCHSLLRCLVLCRNSLNSILCQLVVPARKRHGFLAKSSHRINMSLTRRSPM